MVYIICIVGWHAHVFPKEPQDLIECGRNRLQVCDTARYIYLATSLNIKRPHMISTAAKVVRSKQARWILLLHPNYLDILLVYIIKNLMLSGARLQPITGSHQAPLVNLHISISRKLP